MKEQKIGIIGLGIVGLPLKKYFERKGLKRNKNLFCYDADLSKGFNDDINQADIIFICVPTPRMKNGLCDTRIVDSVVKKFHNKKNVLVIKSTVEPGTIAKLQKKYNCPILFNPEFLTESQAWEDFMRPDRQVVGHTTKSQKHASAVLDILPQAYFSSPGVIGTYDFVGLNSSEAEMGKYAGNVFGAIKVSYANILADLCHALETVLKKQGVKEKINYDNVRHMIAYDSRIGGAWLDVKHGDYRGFGGFCFPKDMSAFISFVKKIEKKIDRKSVNKKLVSKGLAVLEAIWDYNEELLKSQGLTIKQVSSHDNELAKKIKKMKYVK
jgi:UDPglucose 6-dehydrogenase